jgi:hypothetical protein
MKDGGAGRQLGDELLPLGLKDPRPRHICRYMHDLSETLGGFQVVKCGRVIPRLANQSGTAATSPIRYLMNAWPLTNADQYVSGFS